MALIGTKCSVCLFILGLWGVVVLLLMGILSKVNAVAFAEDIPIKEEEWAKEKFSSAYIDAKYSGAALNCFLSALVYTGVTVFAGIQLRLNVRASHMYNTASST